MKTETAVMVGLMAGLVLAALILIGDGASAKNTRLADHVVLIILDSFSPDYMAMYDLPNLRKLADQGVWYARARGVFPSNTTANHTTILTGAYPNKTGIPNNSRYDRDTDRLRSPLRDIQVPTLPEVLNAHGLVTVELAHFLLEGRKAISYAQHGAANFIKAFEAHNPDLLIYLDMDVDTEGHRRGPYNMKEVLQKTDGDIGEMMLYLEEQGKLAKTAFIVASDHGMIENSLPAAAPKLLDDLKKAGFSVATANAQIRKNTDLVAISAGGIFLYIREGRLDEGRMEQLLSFLNGIPNTDILTENDLRARNADPFAVGDIVVVPRCGFVLASGAGGGMHGVPETEHTTLLLSGAGIRQGLVRGRANTVDIAPTILHLLGLDIPEYMDGQVLKDGVETPTLDWRRLLGL